VDFIDSAVLTAAMVAAVIFGARAIERRFETLEPFEPWAWLEFVVCLFFGIYGVAAFAATILVLFNR